MQLVEEWTMLICPDPELVSGSHVPSSGPWVVVIDLIVERRQQPCAV